MKKREKKERKAKQTNKTRHSVFLIQCTGEDDTNFYETVFSHFFGDFWGAAEISEYWILARGIELWSDFFTTPISFCFLSRQRNEKALFFIILIFCSRFTAVSRVVKELFDFVFSSNSRKRSHRLHTLFRIFPLNLSVQSIYICINITKVAKQCFFFRLVFFLLRCFYRRLNLRPIVLSCAHIISFCVEIKRKLIRIFLSHEIPQVLYFNCLTFSSLPSFFFPIVCYSRVTENTYIFSPSRTFYYSKRNKSNNKKWKIKTLVVLVRSR